MQTLQTILVTGPTAMQDSPFLYWLSAPWRINFKLAVLAFKCLHGLAPSYLADELHHPAETEFRQRLWSASSPALSVPHTRLSTYGDRA